MKKYLTVIEAISTFLFGKKYYAIAIYTVGTTDIYLSGELFRTKEAAERRKNIIINEVITYKYVTTVSFRSRNID